MSWELITGVLPWLLFLACPLSMWWMMRGMSHNESCDKQEVAGGNKDEEIRLLKERLAHLEARKQITEIGR
jgi:hypothetical protein